MAQDRFEGGKGVFREGQLKQLERLCRRTLSSHRSRYFM